MTSLKTLKKKEMLNVILQCLWEFKTFGLENTFKTFGLEKTTHLHRHAVLTQSLTSQLVWQYWNICMFINWNGMVRLFIVIIINFICIFIFHLFEINPSIYHRVNSWYWYCYRLKVLNDVNIIQSNDGIVKARF